MRRGLVPKPVFKAKCLEVQFIVKYPPGSKKRHNFAVIYRQSEQSQESPFESTTSIPLPTESSSGLRAEMYSTLAFPPSPTVFCGSRHQATVPGSRIHPRSEIKKRRRGEAIEARETENLNLEQRWPSCDPCLIQTASV